jgi:endonuclease/exonuclease/phosphatase (EEP) superfamily protein YafD
MRPLPLVLRRVVEWTTLAYVAGVLAVTVLLAAVGERWWVTSVALYLPRIIFAAPLPLLVLTLWRWGARRYLALLGVTLVVILVPLMGFTVPAPSLPFGRSAPAPRVRILSYNVNAAAGGVANLSAEVDRFAPDVVLMQEVADPNPLATALRARYPTVLVSDQFIMAARYPVVTRVEPDKLAFEGHRRSPRFVQVTLQTPLGDVAFYNVHPLSPREPMFRLRGRGLLREILSGHLLSGDARAILENDALRDLQVQTFTDEALRDGLPTIIAGDTNLPNLSGILRRHLSRFQDGFEKAGWGFGYTFPTDHVSWMRIDRIFATDDLRFTSFRVGTSLASDHHCVVADLERN